MTLLLLEGEKEWWWWKYTIFSNNRKQAEVPHTSKKWQTTDQIKAHISLTPHVMNTREEKRVNNSKN